jgi:hypothetical protein
MANVGDRRRNPQTGQIAVYDGRNWQLQGGNVGGTGQQGAPVGSAQRGFNTGIGTRDAEDLQNLRAQAAGAGSRFSEAESLLGKLEDTPTGIGASIGQALSTTPLAGYGAPRQDQAARARQIDALSQTATLREAAKLKPVSNSDIAFLQSFQAGSNQGRETNRRFLIANQWYEQKVAAQRAAMERWVANYGNPSATDRNGRSFSDWWENHAAENYPRPTFEGPNGYTGYSGYRAPILRRGSQGRRPVADTDQARGGGNLSGISDAELRAIIARGQ